MTYALILTRDLSRKTHWVCYNLSDNLNDLTNLKCYTPESLNLPKAKYIGTIISEGLEVPSCVTGSKAIFAVCQFDVVVNLASKFKFNEV